MEENIKKITIKNITSKKKVSPKKDVIKKLVSDPNKINTFIKDKVNSIKRDELTSWFVPKFFSKKGIQEQPNKIQSIIKDIQTNRKTNSVLSKKKEKVKMNLQPNLNKDKYFNKDKSTHKPTDKSKVEKTNKHKPNPPIKQRGGRLKSRKEGRVYTKKELKDLYKTLCELYKNDETKKITSILRRLTKNQCNQILHYKKLIKRSWTNAPLPLLRFLVYQTISCPNMIYNVS